MICWRLPGQPCGMSLMRPQSTACASLMAKAWLTSRSVLRWAVSLFTLLKYYYCSHHYHVHLTPYLSHYAEDGHVISLFPVQYHFLSNTQLFHILSFTTSLKLSCVPPPPIFPLSSWYFPPLSSFGKTIWFFSALPVYHSDVLSW